MNRWEQGWLEFDISGVPPGSTVISATLVLSLAYTSVNQYVGVYAESNNFWSENSITWNNAPSGSVSGSATDSRFITNSTTTYGWNVQPLVVGALGSSYLSLVVQPTSSQSSQFSGPSVFDTNEVGPAFAPSLTITYSYVSVSAGLPTGTIAFGNSILVTGSTDPAQTGGLTTLQYSGDAFNWYTITSQPGGTVSYSWFPPSVGTFYIRTQWSISWSGGSYLATSGVSTLVITAGVSSVQLSLSQNIINPTQSVTLTAAVPGQVSDGSVTFQYSTDQNSWSQIVMGTPSLGVFSYSWTPGAVGTYYLRASWSGDANWLPSTSPVQTLVVTRVPTSIILSIPYSTNIGSAVSLTASLHDYQNNPIQGATLVFSIGSSQVGSAITDTFGSATIVYALTQGAGSYPVIASYAGSVENLPSSAQTFLTVNPWKVLVTSGMANLPLVNFNGRNYTTDSTGRVIIAVNTTGMYTIKINTPVVISPGARVVFTQWSDGSTSASRQVNVESDIALSASLKTQYLLSVISSFGNPNGGGWFDSSLTASFAVQSPVDEGNGTRRLFTGWLNNGSPFLTSPSGSIEITGPTSLQANWKTQYYFTLVSEFGKPTGQGQGWYDAGTRLAISVTAANPPNNVTRYVLTGYNGSGSIPPGQSSDVTFALNAPSTLTFLWNTQYYLSVRSELSSVTGSGWYVVGSKANVTIKDSVIAVNVFFSKVFKGWNGDVSEKGHSILVVMDGPKRIVAVWENDFTKLYLVLGASVAAIVVFALVLVRRYTNMAR
jgi:hypothetical protein